MSNPENVILSPEAITVIKHANRSSRETGSMFITSSFLMKGLLEIPNVSNLLKQSKIYPEKLSEYIDQYFAVPARSLLPNIQPQFSPVAISVIKRAKEEARLRNSKEVLPEDILLGIIEKDRGEVAGILVDQMSVDLDSLRNRVRNMLILKGRIYNN